MTKSGFMGALRRLAFRQTPPPYRVVRAKPIDEAQRGELLKQIDQALLDPDYSISTLHGFRVPQEREHIVGFCNFFETVRAEL
jgi:hypothetical protein